MRAMPTSCGLPGLAQTEAGALSSDLVSGKLSAGSTFSTIVCRLWCGGVVEVGVEASSGLPLSCVGQDIANKGQTVPSFSTL